MGRCSPGVRRNVTSGRPTVKEIPEQTREAIRQYNEIDAALHEFVSRRLEARIREAGPAFPAHVKRFRILNRLYNLGRSGRGWFHARIGR